MRGKSLLNENNVKEDIMACYDIINQTNNTSLKDVEKNDPELFNYYHDCFTNLVSLSLTSTKSEYTDERTNEDGTTITITSCSADIAEALRNYGGFVYDEENDCDDLLDTISTNLFNKDFDGSFLFGVNDRQHLVNKIRRSVYTSLVDLVNKHNKRNEHEISIFTEVHTTEDGDTMTIGDTIADKSVNIEDDYITKTTIREVVRDNCLYFIKKKHPDRMLGYILYLLESYYKPATAEDKEYENELLSSMINTYGYQYTIKYFCEEISNMGEYGIDLLDVPLLNITFKKPAKSVTKRNIETWKSRSLEDVRNRTSNYSYI